MRKILQLDEFLSNKIAAGEVVERPASVVKELVENAIDANSRQIRVDIEEGGLSSIRILDDGDGIEKEDMEMAFFRHATSKIKHDEDLFRIKTLGFRGEALPSIASVSKLTLKTSTGKDGHELYLEGGHVKHLKTSTPRKGTEILVTELFFNTPARLKYLKTIHTELGHISDVVNRMALSHPEISFVLTHNQKQLLQTSGTENLPRVIAAIYGSSIAKKMVRLEADSLDFKVEGYVAKPEITRSNRSYMSIILNGRYVKNYPLMKAIQAGYHTLLPIGKFPVVVLHIKMNPILIDVNVHPAKLEVRISKERALQELVTKAIRDLFKKIELIPDVPDRKNKTHEKLEQMSLSITHEIPNELATKNDAPLIKETQQSKQQQSLYSENLPVEKGSNQRINESMNRPIEEENDYPQNKNMIDKDEKVSRIPVLYPIGQLHGTYILAQNEQGLFMIDQHAAQERIKYEFYREKLSSTDNQLQDLLVPLTCEYTQAEESLLMEQREKLEQVGLFLEPFGLRTFIIRAHPTWFPKGQEEETISEILEQLKNERSIDIGKLREKAAILMSCKASIKANRHLTIDEMFQLLETLRKCEDPYTCPHGRPVLIHYSTYEIERMFKRVMS